MQSLSEAPIGLLSSKSAQVLGKIQMVNDFSKLVQFQRQSLTHGREYFQ